MERRAGGKKGEQIVCRGLMKQKKNIRGRGLKFALKKEVKKKRKDSKVAWAEVKKRSPAPEKNYPKFTLET